MTVSLRKAHLADIPAIEALIARSARGLSADDYRPAQVEGALRGAFGVDTQLLTDQTYWLAEEDGIVGCGGWSFRATLFGGDARSDRDATPLDPQTAAAKIRAFFVDPAHARRGIASLLLERMGKIAICPDVELRTHPNLEEHEQRVCKSGKRQNTKNLCIVFRGLKESSPEQKRKEHYQSAHAR